MTLEEYKQLPFKTDGDGEAVKIEEAWYELTRKQRRKIERELKKGRVPDFVDVLFSSEEN